MRKLFYILSGSLLLVLLAALTAWLLLRPKLKPWAEEKIRAELNKSCDTCEFTLDDIELTWQGPALHGIRFTTRPQGQRLEAEISSLYLYPRLDALMLDGELQLRTAVVVQPKLTYYDDANDPAPKTSSDLGLPPHVGISVDNGEFTYIRDVKGTHAVLTIQKVQAQLNTEIEDIHIRASAQLGHTGNLQLTTTADLTKTPFEADIVLIARNQDMKDLSAFFEPNAGVKMEGTLLSGNVTSKVIGTHVKTHLKMEFKDFKLKVNSMYDRSDIQTFFTNIAASAALRKNNTDAREKDKAKSVETDRQKDETVISFILRSWKEAALKVAQ